MHFSYALPYAYWQKVTKNVTKKQLHPKTCQKPYAKTLQKTHKNLVRKNPAKIFYDFLNKKPAKNFKDIQKLPNFTFNTNKTKNPCTS